MRRPVEEPDPAEQTNTVDAPQEPSEPGAEAESTDHPLLGLGLAIETYHRGVT